MVKAQQWLNKKYPKKERSEVTSLYTTYEDLKGDLNLSDFTNLEELNCYRSELTSLKLNNCQKLKKISCYDNQLTTLDLSNLKQLKELDCSDNNLTQIIYPTNPKQITILNISNNNLSNQDLSVFSKMQNLEELNIRNGGYSPKLLSEWNRLEKTYNHFTGSLAPLQNLTKLKKLDISGTDLDSGVEYLPSNLCGSSNISYCTSDRPNCKLLAIKEQLDLFASGKMPKNKKEPAESPNLSDYYRLTKKTGGKSGKTRGGNGWSEIYTEENFLIDDKEFNLLTILEQDPYGYLRTAPNGTVFWIKKKDLEVRYGDNATLCDSVISLSQTDKESLEKQRKQQNKKEHSPREQTTGDFATFLKANSKHLRQAYSDYKVTQYEKELKNHKVTVENENDLYNLEKDDYVHPNLLNCLKKKRTNSLFLNVNKIR